MISGKIILGVVTILLIISLYQCIPMEPVTLHGDLTGQVIDAETSQPLQAAALKLDPSNDTTSTGSDGKYLFKNLIPGDYDIEASKPPYATDSRRATVTSANITEINFALHKIPYPEFSERYLDFGFDSTIKSFTIKNTGTGKLQYSITTSQDWLEVNPNNSEATTETDTIKVTINRTGLSEKKHIESLEIVSHVGLDLVRNTINVYVNGIIDRNKNYYDIVTIGTQTWMAENLNTGNEIPLDQNQQDNDIVEKWCQGGIKNNCSTYGGLYQWNEMMQFNPGDDGMIGTTQGICPAGWHIPTYTEWKVLNSYLILDGGSLKETGTGHWKSPNEGATNESGFTALPAGSTGERDGTRRYGEPGLYAFFWSSQPNGWTEYLTFDSKDIKMTYSPLVDGNSVRCIKDP